MDKECICLELALNGGVNFGMAEGAQTAVADVGLTIIEVAFDQIVGVSLLDGVRTA